MNQHDGWAFSRVGWTIPATHANANSLHIEHPIRTLTYRASVTCRSNQDLCLSCDNCLLEIVTRVSGGSMIVHPSEEKKGGWVWLRVLSASANKPAMWPR